MDATKPPLPKLNFEILMDDEFAKLLADKSLSPIERKRVLSIINDFEDGEWRYSKFQNFIWDNIAETALSLRERNSLVDKSHTALTNAAKNLRLTDKENDVGRGSELAANIRSGTGTGRRSGGHVDQSGTERCVVH